MSSSSSEPDGVQGLLGRSLQAIRDSVPSQYAAIVTALQHDVVQLQVDHETFSIHAQPHGLALAGAEPSAAVRLTTKSCTITALIDGTLDLIDAVLGENIALFGSVNDLLSFNEALSAYLHGAVRSSGQEAILREFRLLAERRKERE